MAKGKIIQEAAEAIVDAGKGAAKGAGKNAGRAGKKVANVVEEAVDAAGSVAGSAIKNVDEAAEAVKKGAQKTAGASSNAGKREFPGKNKKNKNKKNNNTQEIGAKKKGTSESVNVGEGPIKQNTTNSQASGSQGANPEGADQTNSQSFKERFKANAGSRKKYKRPNTGATPNTGKTHESILKSNSSINKGLHNIYDFASDGVDGLYQTGKKILDYEGDKGLIGRTSEAFKSVYTNDAGKLDVKKAAASYFVANSAIRAVSGGGVYKDRNGNTDLMGVPFV